MTERHTRQGTPRRELTQMGDRLEDDTPDWRVRPSAVGGSKQSLRVLGGLGGCWCGLPMGHPWPGHDTGKPHPRDMGDALRRKSRRG